MGEVSRFPRGKQVASYLGLIPREHSSGGRQKLGAITKQGNRMLRMLLVEAAQSAVRYDPEFRRAVSAPLPFQGESSGQGGSGAQVGHTTVPDATHAAAVSGSRSYREQPDGGPGRPPRWIDR